MDEKLNIVDFVVVLEFVAKVGNCIVPQGKIWRAVCAARRIGEPRAAYRIAIAAPPKTNKDNICKKNLDR